VPWRSGFARGDGLRWGATAPLRYAPVGMTILFRNRTTRWPSRESGGPSASLRYGRDDNSAWMLGFGTENSGGPRGALQIPPLRYASVGMTKGRGRFHSHSILRMMNSRSLRFAPTDFLRGRKTGFATVGMTLLFLLETELGWGCGRARGCLGQLRGPLRRYTASARRWLFCL
jgi:hypothetical protein